MLSIRDFATVYDGPDKKEVIITVLPPKVWSFINRLYVDSAPPNVDLHPNFRKVIDNSIVDIEAVVSKHASIEVFKNAVDHFGRPMKLFVLNDYVRDWHYLIEFCSRIENKVKFSKFARFVLKMFPKLEKHFIQFESVLIFEMRIWYDPEHYVRMDLHSISQTKLESVSRLSNMKDYSVPKNVNPEKANEYYYNQYTKRKRLLRRG